MREAELLKALQRFEKRIVLDAAGVSSTILSDVVSRNVKISYYLGRISIMSTYMNGPKIVFDVQYTNTGMPLKDIYVVSSAEEAQSVLCQYIGNYKSRVIIFAKPNIDIPAEYNRFAAVNAVFYPNFVGAGVMRGQHSVSPMPYYDFSFKYRVGTVKLSMMETETDREVERIAKLLFLPGMDDATKAFLAHNYLADTIDYTLIENASGIETSYMQSAYGALVKKKCVCQGYAEAFKRLMDFEGIPCDVVCGQTKGATTYHAWNILKLNDERDNYHIDVTWDSSDARVSYKYFGLRDSDFIGNRTWSREYNATCNSSKNLLALARWGVMRFKSKLIAKGVDPRILGC